jgi:hypothetical protein
LDPGRITANPEHTSDPIRHITKAYPGMGRKLTDDFAVDPINLGVFISQHSRHYLLTEFLTVLQQYP